jgi:RNA polymerase sigma factor (sigma-70 family)
VFSLPGGKGAPQARAQAGDAPADEAVATALARGDRTLALTRLMQRHGDEIHRFCVGMLEDRALADDVHQAVFVQAYEGLANFRGDGSERSWRAWLFGIARHRCLDAQRARKRWRWRFGRAPEAAPEAVAPEPIELGEHDGTTAALLDCLRGLPPHVRVAVLLRYEEGLPYEEIARLSRESAAAVQMRVARALPALRDCIAGKAAP